MCHFIFRTAILKNRAKVSFSSEIIEKFEKLISCFLDFLGLYVLKFFKKTFFHPKKFRELFLLWFFRTKLGRLKKKYNSFQTHLKQQIIVCTCIVGYPPIVLQCFFMSKTPQTLTSTDQRQCQPPARPLLPVVRKRSEGSRAVANVFHPLICCCFLLL